MKANFNVAKRAGTLLGAIAAGALLGLPVLAQNTPSPATNAAPDPAAPGRSFPNQADPRAGEGNLNNGVSTPPIQGGNANEYNYQNRPSSENRPSEDRPTENRPSGNMQSPMMQPGSMSPVPMSPQRANPGRSESTDSQFRPAPSATPDPAAPGVRELPNQADPRTGLPESQPQNTPTRSNRQSSTQPMAPMAVTPGITDYPNQVNPLTGASDVALERGSAIVPADGVSAESGYRFSRQVYGTDRAADSNTVSLGQ